MTGDRLPVTDHLSPSALGFRMPAEWAPHRGTWLSWPHKEASWPGKFGPVPGIFAAIVAALVPHEEVHINVGDEALEQSARAELSRRGIALAQVRFHRHPTDDAWCRDHGPMFVQRPGSDGRAEQLILDWGYNAWGGKYPPFALDDAIPTRIAEELGLPVVAPGMVLEGGSIDVDGAGTLLTTEQCLLNPNRNPGLSRQQIEQRLGGYLGVEKVLWLGDGIEGDDTDGHVDDLTRFVAPATVVTAVEPDPRDPNHGPLRDNLARLRAMTTAEGTPLRVVELPMPPALFYEGQRLPVSYANFYIANGAVLLPGFDAARDAQARAVLQPLFPTRPVVTIDCTDLVWGLGAIHCVTQQWPAA
ncbi:MAG TPA: agmatine deiminase family protein [Gemmatimonadales bacterium]|nr:agmatine deiminase family protein [Gemmatimonadales bacterium]